MEGGVDDPGGLSILGGLPEGQRGSQALVVPIRDYAGGVGQQGVAPAEVGQGPEVLVLQDGGGDSAVVGGDDLAAVGPVDLRRWGREKGERAALGEPGGEWEGGGGPWEAVRGLW